MILTYLDAYKIKLALNAARLEPRTDESAALLSDVEHAALTKAVDIATLKPSQCGHLEWKWPMRRCPSCGTSELNRPT